MENDVTFLDLNKSHKSEELRVLKALEGCEPGGEHYDELLKNLQTLSDVRIKSEDRAYKTYYDDERLEQEKKRDKFLFVAKIVSAFTALGTFLLMLKQEITGSFRSKGFSWFTDFLRKSDKN